jgi:hypothetical protein
MPLFGEHTGGQAPLEPPIALRRGIGAPPGGVCGAGTVVLAGGAVWAVGRGTAAGATGVGA